MSRGVSTTRGAFYVITAIDFRRVLLRRWKMHKHVYTIFLVFFLLPFFFFLVSSFFSPLSFYLLPQFATPSPLRHSGVDCTKLRHSPVEIGAQTRSRRYFLAEVKFPPVAASFSASPLSIPLSRFVIVNQRRLSTVGETRHCQILRTA